MDEQLQLARLDSGGLPLERQQHTCEIELAPRSLQRAMLQHVAEMCARYEDLCVV